MKLQFFKYQGTGNDFIMLDNMKNHLNLSAAQIQFLCDRKLGIGADGIILLENDEGADFNVNYYNSDGSQSFCGNGSRCSVAFAKKIGLIDHSCSFSAIDGVHSGEIFESGIVKVSMGNVTGVEALGDDFVLNTGSPHYVKRCNTLNELNIITEAHKIRYNSRFSSEGINVNFVHETAGFTEMRTYERGVEDETLSCGTGVTAVALSLSKKEGVNSKVIKTKGGILSVDFIKTENSFTDIFLSGPALAVYSGVIEF